MFSPLSLSLSSLILIFLYSLFLCRSDHFSALCPLFACQIYVYGHDPQLIFFPWLLERFYLWRVRHGSTIILHDGSRRRAENTARIIKYLRAHGIQLRAFPQDC
jgi:hypothetical protein